MAPKVALKLSRLNWIATLLHEGPEEKGGGGDEHEEQDGGEGDRAAAERELEDQ